MEDLASNGNIDANGVTTTLTYDDLHRLRTRTVAGVDTEAYGYTAKISGPTSYTNRVGKVTQYAYHAAGWKTNEVIVGVATNKFSYDAASCILMRRWSDFRRHGGN